MSDSAGAYVPPAAIKRIVEVMIAENRLALNTAAQARSVDAGSDETARLVYEATAVSKLFHACMLHLTAMKAEFEACSRRLGPRKDV